MFGFNSKVASVQELYNRLAKVTAERDATLSLCKQLHEMATSIANNGEFNPPEKKEALLKMLESMKLLIDQMDKVKSK